MLNKINVIDHLILLNVNIQSQEIHIFINGFMSDELEDYKAKDWQNGLEKFISSTDKKFIYKWESSFDYNKSFTQRNKMGFLLTLIFWIVAIYFGYKFLQNGFLCKLLCDNKRS